MKNRIIIASLMFWAFVNLVILVWSYYGKTWEPKYPFRSGRGSMFGSLEERYLTFFGDLTRDPIELLYPFNTNDYKAYDITVFLLYAITLTLLYFLYKYVKGENELLLP